MGNFGKSIKLFQKQVYWYKEVYFRVCGHGSFISTDEPYQFHKITYVTQLTELRVSQQFYFYYRFELKVPFC